ncbi:DnaJ-like protein [Hoeflea marina]|uniref:DnaJ-like protein n=1 Tax=Hoeflea marina TaxID=274592 RepID=A0A317PSJ2_9HYPH|nr:DnaJ C-terminal domain-containing protein [Hoeflea marina]PWW01864.1 DnaJ-like protein [Hoeflea marina]
MRSPYAVLGVPQGAEPNDIKLAYRRLAKTWHPDQNQADPLAGERFAEIAHAYRLLINAELRAKFDGGEIDARGRRRNRTDRSGGPSPFSVFRDAWRKRPDPRAPTDAAAKESVHQGDDVSGFDDMVNHIFGESAQRRTVHDAPGMADGAGDSAGSTPGAEQAGADPLAVLDELFAKWKTLHRRQARPETSRHLLELDIAEAFTGALGEITLPSGGQLAVPVPAGTADGAELHIPVPASHATGDALVTIRYRPHPQFRILGNDLHTDHAIDLRDAVLGTQVTLETLDGPLRLTIPEWAGASGGMTVSGRGLPRPEGGRGELYVHLRVLLPETPDDSLIALMRSQRKAVYV